MWKSKDKLTALDNRRKCVFVLIFFLMLEGELNQDTVREGKNESQIERK
jgi:hypothetical protein